MRRRGAGPNIPFGDTYAALLFPNEAANGKDEKPKPRSRGVIEKYFLECEGNVEGNAGAITMESFIQVLNAMMAVPALASDEHVFLDVGCSTGRTLLAAAILSNSLFTTVSGFELPANSASLFTLEAAIDRCNADPNRNLSKTVQVNWTGKDILHVTQDLFNSGKATHVYSFWQTIPHDAQMHLVSLVKNCPTARCLAVNFYKGLGAVTVAEVLEELGPEWGEKAVVRVAMRGGEKKVFHILAKAEARDDAEERVLSGHDAVKVESLADTSSRKRKASSK